MIMANKLFQSVIHQIKDVINRTVGVIDSVGVVISSTDLGAIGEVRAQAAQAVFGQDPVGVFEGFTYRTFGGQSHPEYAIFVEGEDDFAATQCKVLSISLSSIKQFYDEKYDRGNFIKNVMLDNILPGDIFIKSRELHFDNDTTHAVLLIRLTDQIEANVIDIIQPLFPDCEKDFVININENDIAVVKEIPQSIESKDLEKLARSVSDALAAELYTKTLVGIGTAVTGIKELARSFKEAQVALEVGKVFDTEKTIVSYENLGIARLIYQLPTTLCEMFLREVFKRGSIDHLDSETLFTIQKFFENNLNVSETSRKLFVHRNTLVYRLEKIRKLTGLDLREFDDAIVFKVALMVKKYLDVTPSKF